MSHAAAAAAAALTPGTLLAGRYEIERELGRGGMATVYLARDAKHGRQVAVKVLHAELASALGSERFLREIRIAARLAHPHVLPLHDSGRREEVLAMLGKAVDAGWGDLPALRSDTGFRRLRGDRAVEALCEAVAARPARPPYPPELVRLSTATPAAS